MNHWGSTNGVKCTSYNLRPSENGSGEDQSNEGSIRKLWRTPWAVESTGNNTSSEPAGTDDNTNDLTKQATKLSWKTLMTTLSSQAADRTLTPEEIKRRKNPGAVALHKFSQRTSLAGITYIIDTTSHIHRAFWILICLIAGGATFYQLVLLMKDYTNYPYVTNLNDVNKALAFPSITICNSNIVRRRKVEDLPPHAVSFIEQHAPPTEFTYALPNDTDTDKRKRRRKREAEVISSTEQLISEYQEIMGGLSRELRIDVGHQWTDTMIDCVYNGYICAWSDFSHFLSDKYGNCYTYNSAEIRAEPLAVTRSGARHGLNLEMYLDKNQYLPGFVQETGAYMVVHEFGTYPIIDERAVGLSPGQINYVAMSATEYVRLGAPWNPCGDKGDFSGYFNVTYTKQACQATCADRLVAENCSCVRPESTSYYPVHMQESLPKCQASNDGCVNPIEAGERASNISCGCSKSCQEYLYSLSLSASVWPNVEFYYSLADEACGILPRDECEHLRSKNGTVLERTQVLRENFLKLSVYYETLTVVEVNEQSVYSTSNLLSNIGGTLGLYIGATIINIIEFLDFLLQFFYECCKCCHRKGRKGRKKKNDKTSGQDESGDGGLESSTL